MRPINLIDFVQLPNESSEELISEYLMQMSKSDESVEVKKHEYLGIKSLMKSMIETDNELGIGDFEGFYVSYNIPQISKEFDLLKIDKEKVLNIEIKSRLSNYTTIIKQMSRNIYYLGSLEKKIFVFTYISDTNKVYRLDENNEVVETGIQEIINVIKKTPNVIDDDLDTLFQPEKYLVSPFNSPDRFLKKQYFLTSEQEENRTSILNIIKTNKKIVKLSGSAGTGKTLLLYDIAIELSKTNKVLIFHSGNLNDGQKYINRKNVITIKPIKRLNKTNLSEYDCVLIDESQRLRVNQFEKLITEYNDANYSLIFSIDPSQVLNEDEMNVGIIDKINEHPNINVFRLNSKIRTNKKIAQFIKELFNPGSSKQKIKTNNIKLVYSKNLYWTKLMIQNYEKKGYTYLSYTPSNYNTADWYDIVGDLNAHDVIGQEFDKVMLVMGNEISYDGKNQLISKKHPYRRYNYRNMLFQQITRVRKELLIIIYDNYELYKSVSKLLV